jgi:hypothetical protein
MVAVQVKTDAEFRDCLSSIFCFFIYSAVI